VNNAEFEPLILVLHYARELKSNFLNFS